MLGIRLPKGLLEALSIFALVIVFIILLNFMFPWIGGIVQYLLGLVVVAFGIYTFQLYRRETQAAKRNK
ncbi:hypothetical protein [Lacticaseibacillus paracasei]|jgi:glucose-6-phosphate-specific signal transduction histidine kinase|uniref:hypothetical protein n=1 Tax=Lacticaseibacillus paracasei TaxID=1597 RepID=UPI000F43A1B6|nr:hypothetical protein [Lacticaseibacillus paracasei]RND41738.1 hypothetical protein FAM10859_00342 [Lacticaseibacillus paracasei]